MNTSFVRKWPRFNLRVIPSLGQIVEGYLLIVPENHYTALADMPLEVIDELSELCGRIRTYLSSFYGPCLFFEHGVRATKSGGCGIDHAHLHAVPFPLEKEPFENLQAGHLFKQIRHISEIDFEVPNKSSYLYYENLNGQRYVTNTNFIPSQFMRRLLAELIGIDLWDWRQRDREQALMDTFNRLSSLFSDDGSGQETEPKLTLTAPGIP